MQPVYIPKNPHEKAMQRALIQYRDPKNYDLVMEALKKEGRMDLVGFGKECLIPPRKLSSERNGKSGRYKSDGRNKPEGRNKADGRNKSDGRNKAARSAGKNKKKR